MDPLSQGRNTIKSDGQYYLIGHDGSSLINQDGAGVVTIPASIVATGAGNILATASRASSPPVRATSSAITQKGRSPYPVSTGIDC